MFRIVLGVLVAAAMSVAGSAQATDCTAAFCLPSAVSKVQTTTLFVPQQTVAVQSLAVPSVAVQQTTTPLVIQQVTPLAVVQQIEPVVVKQQTVVRTRAVRSNACNSRVRAFGRGIRCR